MTIVGTRPEIIRLSATIKRCDELFDHTLVHTGQNWDYTLNEVFFEDLGIRPPDFYLESVGSNLGETMGNIIAKSYSLLSETQPEALLILGDTNSTLSAISAKRLKIPIFHMEAGNRCFDENVPEEINRRIVDHVSDVNLPYTEHSRRYLLAEGLRRDHIFVTGSPMPEVLASHTASIQASDILGRLGLIEDGFILVSAHREENVDQYANFDSLMNGLNHVAEQYHLPVVYSAHPRARDRIAKRSFDFNPLVRLVDPLGYFDYNQLQLHAYCVLSDSGTLSEESAIMGFNAVLIRTSTERPEAIENGCVVIGGINGEDMIRAIELARAVRKKDQPPPRPSDYTKQDVSTTVARIVQSYTPIVNRVIWAK